MRTWSFNNNWYSISCNPSGQFSTPFTIVYRGFSPQSKSSTIRFMLCERAREYLTSIVRSTSSRWICYSKPSKIAPLSFIFLRLIKRNSSSIIVSRWLKDKLKLIKFYLESFTFSTNLRFVIHKFSLQRTS